VTDTSDSVRWNLSVPRETDASLRAYLGQIGYKKGNLSEFVADAVRWRLSDLNATAARARNSEVPPEEIENAIEEALAEVRTAKLHRQNAAGQ
jgi:hypothetical protein